MKNILVGIIVLAGSTLMTVAFVYLLGGSGDTTGAVDAVRVEDGVQIIRVKALGGYSPRVVNAQAGVPTRIEMQTKGTYDCSSWLVIPSLRYQKQLPSKGVTNIDVPPQEKGSTITGLCAMGMYSFDVIFN
ncbi:MAG: cupredoxin domain-containing protein [Patescibacteria group bacterium]